MLLIVEQAEPTSQLVWFLYKREKLMWEHINMQLGTYDTNN